MRETRGWEQAELSFTYEEDRVFGQRQARLLGVQGVVEAETPHSLDVVPRQRRE